MAWSNARSRISDGEKCPSITAHLSDLMSWSSDRITSGFSRGGSGSHQPPSAASHVRRPVAVQDMVENSGRYRAAPATPDIFAALSTSTMNTSSGRSHSHEIPMVLAGLNPKRG